MTSHTTSAPVLIQADPTKLRLSFIAIGITLFFASMGQTIVSTAMPVMVADLQGMELITWVITAYLLASTVSAPIAGKLGDLYGRKNVLQGGLVIFSLGAILCGISLSMPTMIAGRALQGAGAGALIVTSMAVVADLLPPRDRSKAQGVLGGAFGISAVIGPLLGGFIVEKVGWHWIFFVNLPVGVLAAIVIGAALPRRAHRDPVKLDYAGAAFLTAILSSAVLISNLGGSSFAWTSPTILTLAMILIVSMLGMAWAENKASEPILPLSMFRNNVFLVMNSVGILIGMGMFGTIALIPMFLQIVKGASPTTSGLFLIPMMLGLILSSIAAGQWMSRTGHYKMLPTISTAIMACALYSLSTLTADSPLWAIAASLACVGIGLGPVFAVGVSATQNAVPKSMTGVATASVNMFRLIGGSIGTAAFGAIFNAGLQRRLVETVPAETFANFRSLNAEMVAGLPPEQQLSIVEGVSAALHPVYWIAAAAALLACLISLALKEKPFLED